MKTIALKAELVVERIFLVHRTTLVKKNNMIIVITTYRFYDKSITIILIMIICIFLCFKQRFTTMYQIPITSIYFVMIYFFHFFVV